ncbi:oxygen-insensitive NADPH nitroreductase [Alkalihalobacterium chitinilyticum]|uniref:Oxygen-insensitive NADPH nitroreductase n=1 Tax=Alkalihalobacterium chitinilyticum TaxID=2980103 RepID=A0ABT5VEA7_9BACI|nr:oxygen-insensitive NADPH nitroreductase [Alkalihalobacterium chitinilyticum]MDE5412544.1 oxygen-insensitive NADPH nitroreductase [Alkalihalobacterium chitinilyticum]
MNQVIETIKNHRSIRSYTNEPVSENHLETIVEAAQAAPSWINGQQVSIVAVKDDQTKKKLTELVGNQKYVDETPVFFIFCADFYRASLAAEKEGTSFAIEEEIDSLLVGATDVGLAMGNAIAAAESLGLGCVPIGGVRRHSLEVIKLLNLPKYVIPISGLCIGYAAEDPGQKPRFPKEAVYHEETYNPDLKGILDTYDQQMEQYMKERTNGQMSSNWSTRVASFYSKPYYDNIAEMLKQQGFICKNIK